VTLELVGLRCRTADRTAGTAAATEALVGELGARNGAAPKLIGTAEEPRERRWEDDLRDARGCLLEAGGQVEDALGIGAFPVLVAGDCSIAITTLPAVARARPEATVLWLDAHGDFHTPETTTSGYLGGMCLAAACGVWDAGLGQPALDPAQVVQCGVRDVDAGEQVMLETRGVARVLRPGALAETLAGRAVYVHLDLDVLDPTVLPTAFPVPGGLSDGGLRTLLAEVAAATDVIGCEVTSFAVPELAELVATIVDPLLP
jgi:arginase